MKSFCDAILNQCIEETNSDISLNLATCLGEIGAIDGKLVDGDENQNQLNAFDNSWMYDNGAPWKSKFVKVRCQLQLITKHFVTALKVAPTPIDQHKIGFAIQEGMSKSAFYSYIIVRYKLLITCFHFE
jgi:hypothetical protein